MAHAAVVDEVVGQGTREGPARAGDHHGAVGVPHLPGLFGSGRRLGSPHQPGHLHGTRAQRHLGPAERGDVREEAGRVLMSVEVDEEEAARVLQLCGTDEAAYGGCGQAGPVGGAVGEHEQGGIREPVGGEPCLHGAQGVRRRLAYGLGVAARAAPEDDDVGFGDVVEGRGGHGSRNRRAVRGRSAPVRGEYDPARCGLFRAGRRLVERYGVPVHAVERTLTGGPRRLGELFGGDGTHGERPDRRDGAAGGVGQVQGDGAARAGPDPYPEGGGAGRRQLDVFPGERQLGPVVRGVHPYRVQGRVEQRGVDAELRCSLADFVSDLDLRVHLGAQSPGGTQPLERGPVDETRRGETFVRTVQRDGFGAGRRPLGEVEARVGTRGAEGPGGVPGPGVARRGVLRPRVDRAPPAAVGGPGSGVPGPGVLRLGPGARGVRHALDENLDLDRTVLGQYEGGGEGELFEV